REVGDRRSEGAELGNLGTAYLVLGEMRRALEFFEQATVIARETGDPGVEGNALWNMALALHQLGDRAQAIMRAEAALVLHERLGAPQAEMVRKVLAEWKAGAGREPSVSPAPGLVQGLIALLRRIWKK
ncbi:MAG TPA: tetratricopeptide repeat protein, partial [Blastocatellia bacterium]|nr:tetratricopeptide repeat protein [Blastocatellia bacterium]